MKTAFIYVLKCPLTEGEQAINYVGMASNPQARYCQHVKASKRLGIPSAHWIHSLKLEFLEPVMEIVDEALEKEAGALEAAYIEYFRNQGCPLLNVTLGGDGGGRGEANGMFGRTHTDSAREIQRTVNIGRIRTLESRERQSRSAKGKPKKTARTPQHCEKISQSKSGKKISTNKSGFAGVHWNIFRNKWQAVATFSRKRNYIGIFSKREDAVFARALWLDLRGAPSI